MDEARRRFLKWMTALGSFITGTLVGVPALRAFLSPAFRPVPDKRWTKIGEAAQIEPGVPVRFDFTESVNDAWVEARVQRGVWIYTEDGSDFTVYSGICTHLACSYAFDSTQERFDCPCHHGLYDPKTGAVLGGPPPRPLDTLEIKIEDGDLYVAYHTFRAGIPEKIVVS